MPTYSFISLFTIDPLAATVMILVGVIGLIVGLFAVRYMEGDSLYTLFFCRLSMIVLAVMAMAAADNLLLLLVAWGISNYLLVRLMIHKPQWQAAANAGWLAAKTFLIGFTCLATAFACLYLSTGTSSIHAMLTSIDPMNPLVMIATILITIAAMTQSAIWPFHRWLLSSLNSPTPVSAIMHAGLVNGGGVLLARFAPLYFSRPTVLLNIFLIGMGTAFAGSLWKLMQSDIKRMLACSTMAQMGYMLAQCGLGLFPAAIAHLCWHGLFKANLFLSSNSAQQEKRFPTGYPPTIFQLLLALVCGIYGSYVFTLASHQSWVPNNTSLILIGMVVIAVSQLALKFIQDSSWKRLPTTLAVISIVCTLYGFSILAIEHFIAPLQLMRPQPLNLLHILSLVFAFMMWMAMLFQSQLTASKQFEKISAWLYVKLLNASQPHPSSITAIRQQYRYE